MAKVQYFDPKTITINDSIAVRSSNPDKKEVARMADSMLYRLRAGQEPQIMAGLVRIEEDDTVTLIDGRNRLDAVLLANTKLAKDEDPIQFKAEAFPCGDEAAIITAFQANFHAAMNLWDKAEAVGKLKALGKTDKEIQEALSLGSEASVRNILAAAKLPAKLKKLQQDGLVGEAFLYELARYAKDRESGKIDPELAEVLAQDALGYMEQLNSRLEEAQQDDDKAEEAENKESGSKSKSKSAGNAPKSDAVKGGKKRKAGAGEVKKAAAKRGLKKTGASESSTGRSWKQLFTLFSSQRDEAGELPEPIADFFDCLEAWRDNEKSDKQLLNQVFKSCRDKYPVKKAAASE